MRVIFDANIWVSFALGKRLAGLREILNQDFIQIFSSKELLHEIRRACRKPQVRKYLTGHRYKQLMELHQNFTNPSHFTHKVKLSRDPNDDYLLDIGEHEDIDFLVTGDKDLLAIASHKNMKIVRYSEFLMALEEHSVFSLKGYQEILPSGIVIVHAGSAHALQLEALQRKVFPSLAEDELLHASQYIKHLEVFPEGQFVALDGDKVVGATTSMRYHFNPLDPEHHTFKEVMGGGWLTTHEPDGEW
ncbi:MAG TPA: putative toxin-antitoxin system toxin component, PIN family, partial [Chitinophagales bacterium]|nr:putative toxin-antitoxin system toxin component, PIN family [Chitinophagales bacterium]